MRTIIIEPYDPGLSLSSTLTLLLTTACLLAVIEKLHNIGYTHEGDLGIKGREAFKYNEKEKAHLVKHHLYVWHKDNPELRRHLALRDFLR